MNEVKTFGIKVIIILVIFNTCELNQNIYKFIVVKSY